ncbi:hypothetical protein COY95_05250 [Candidatus Woesearchaeota archaeon CG_4_10_14_0_8_um_filter_47_5]|nr:MAG: hypothetical protein COY95_05250 [Candidatus Woesearchaeota archaeon CG_4_10_14_0_8_um_filter_47_5]
MKRASPSQKQELLQTIRSALAILIKEHGISEHDVLTQIAQERFMASIPLALFQNRNLTVLEAIVLYLREKHHLPFKKIGALLNRSEIPLSVAYRRARKKHPQPLADVLLSPSAPAPSINLCDVFADSRHSPLESLVGFFREKENRKLHEIADILNRDDRTIWTAYHRFQKRK